MKKSDKKTEQQLVQVLTRVCEQAKDEVQGFQWLTHLVNYQHFPESLLVVCIFDTDKSLENALNKTQNQLLVDLIERELKTIHIRFNQTKQHLLFDTEQACHREHQGKWKKRLSLIS